MNLRFLQLHSLKTRVTLFTLAIFLGSIWALSFYTSRMLQVDMERLLGEQQLSVVSATASHLSRELTDRLRSLGTIAKEVDAELIGHPAALQARLEQRPLLQVQFNGGAWFSRQDGIVVASNLPSLIGTNYADREYMIAVLKEGKSTISKPITGKVLKDPIVVMAVPVRDAKGRVIGALAGVTDLSKPSFLDDITQNPYGKTGGYFIIALQHRLVVTATDKSRVMQALPPPGINPVIDRFIAGYEGYAVLVNAVGVGVLSSSKVVAAAPWAVSASIPTVEAFEPIRTMQQRMFLATFFLTLLAGGLTWWMLRRQLSPLVATTNAMVALSNTDQIPAPLSVTSQDEIGQLASGFNRLIGTWKQREAALNMSEREYRSLLDNLSSGVVVHSPDTSILLSNTMAAALLGLTQDQMLGKTATDPDWCFLQEDGTPMPLKDYPVNRVIASGEHLQNYVVGIHHPDRTNPTWVLCSAYPMRDEEGQVIQVVVTFTDITARQQAQDGLKQSEERWKFAIEGAGDGLWDWNIQTGEAFYSPRYKQMFGYADADIGTTSDEWSKRIHPEDAPGVFATIQPYFDGKPGAASVEFRMLCKDGSWKWTLGRGMVVNRDADGKPLRMIGTNADISERKQAEKNLRQAMTQWQSTFDATNDAICILDIDQKILNSNAAMGALAGCSSESLIGRHCFDVVHGTMGPIRDCPMKRARTSLRRERMELHLGDRWLEVTVDPIVGEGQVFHSAVHIIRDITERKLAELEVKELNTSLEARVLARTADLEVTNQLLIQAKLQADAANVAKSAFLANMSHEIRTPMNGIIGMANVLRLEGVSPKQAQRLDTIDMSAQHLLSVINNILDISKIEAGKLTLEVAPVAVSSVMANVKSIIAERTRTKGIELLIQSDPLPANLVGDPTRLQQALLNYASNAVKFTEKGTVILRTVKQEETDDSVMLRFEVQDSGIGISPEAMSRLFGAFEQADNSMTRQYGGTGLGLAITKRLADLMGGSVGAQSTPGVGSTFWFSVKLKKSSEVAPATPSTPVDAEAVIRQTYYGHRILVVDDEPINREVTLMQLQAVDLLVDTAADGAEAITLARKHNYAAILMDMQMPRINGLEATQQIRQIHGYRHTPIIAMTANAFAEDKAQCFAAGMNDFLIKPFNPQELFATLLRSLSRRDV